MTKEPTMSPEAQRIAIALQMGSKWIPVEYGPTFEEIATNWPREILTFLTPEEVNDVRFILPLADPKTGKAIYGIPDYLNDLNAMHEAEKALDHSDQYDKYVSHLWRVINGKSPDGYYHWSDNQGLTTSATASQRAEAFLRTLNLWKS